MEGALRELGVDAPIAKRDAAGWMALRVARKLVAGEIGVITASRELAWLRYIHEVEPQVAEVLLIFTGIHSETDTLPLGEVRKEWNPDVLKRKDKEIMAAEGLYRESAINAATEVIRLPEIPSKHLL